jgi:hypothetical protein
MISRVNELIHFTKLGLPRPLTIGHEDQNDWVRTCAHECRKRDPNAKFGGGEAFDENEAYDPKSNTWLTLAKLPGGRQAIGAATDGSAAYVPGGTLRCGGLSLTARMLVVQLKSVGMRCMPIYLNSRCAACVRF